MLGAAHHQQTSCLSGHICRPTSKQKQEKQAFLVLVCSTLATALEHKLEVLHKFCSVLDLDTERDGLELSCLAGSNAATYTGKSAFSSVNSVQSFLCGLKNLFFSHKNRKPALRPRLCVHEAIYTHPGGRYKPVVSQASRISITNTHL